MLARDHHEVDNHVMLCCSGVHDTSLGGAKKARLTKAKWRQTNGTTNSSSRSMPRIAPDAAAYLFQTEPGEMSGSISMILASSVGGSDRIVTSSAVRSVESDSGEAILPWPPCCDEGSTNNCRTVVNEAFATAHSPSLLVAMM